MQNRKTTKKCVWCDFFQGHNLFVSKCIMRNRCMCCLRSTWRYASKSWKPRDQVSNAVQIRQGRKLEENGHICRYFLLNFSEFHRNYTSIYIQTQVLGLTFPWNSSLHPQKSPNQIHSCKKSGRSCGKASSGIRSPVWSRCPPRPKKTTQKWSVAFFPTFLILFVWNKLGGVEKMTSHFYWLVGVWSPVSVDEVVHSNGRAAKIIKVSC